MLRAKAVRLLPLSKPAPFCETVPNQFAERVLQRHQWERRKLRWLRGGSLLALAASLLFAVGVWYLTPPSKGEISQINNPTNTAQERSQKMLEEVRSKFVSLQSRAFFLPGTFNCNSRNHHRLGTPDR